MTSVWVTPAMAMIDATALIIALPALQSGFGATGPQLLWILNAYGIPLTALLLVGGVLGVVLAWMAIGVGIGTALGAATGNMGTGIAIGIAIGLAIGAGLDANAKKKE